MFASGGPEPNHALQLTADKRTVVVDSGERAVAGRS